ncbi:hypothetical protein V7127_17510 [Bacillus sp. JJ1773]|uniref:hypothetical protein n=1 Tax=Bacillus sp. JJ1773 TaxID=3122965 RepID=UPI002FFE3727
MDIRFKELYKYLQVNGMDSGGLSSLPEDGNQYEILTNISDMIVSIYQRLSDLFKN